jgi:general secretion pathway protein G
MVSAKMALPSAPPRRGFTLIELVVVLAILGLLLTIAVPKYLHTVDHGRVAVQRQNIAAVRDAIDKFHGDQGRYPESLDELVQARYLRAIPLDPATERPDWTVVAPPDQSQVGVYDVRSSAKPRTGADRAS